MSSHHIIRDDQEPALCLLEPEKVDTAIIFELLEWSPRVIAHSDSLDWILKWGGKVDVVFSQPSSLETARKNLDFQSPVEILKSSGSLLHDTLHYLGKRPESELNVVASGESVLKLLRKPLGSNEHSIVFYGDGHKTSRASTGVFQKWVNAGVSFQCLPTEPPDLQTQGLKKIREHTWLSISQGTVQLSSKKVFWVVEMTEKSNS